MSLIFKHNPNKTQVADKQRVKRLFSMVLVFLTAILFSGCSSEDEETAKEKITPSEEEIIQQEKEDIKEEVNDPVVRNYVAGMRVARLLSVDPEKWPTRVTRTPAAQWLKYLVGIYNDPASVKEGIPLMLILNPPSEKSLEVWVDSLMAIPDDYFPPLSESLRIIGYEPPKNWTSAHEHTLLAFLQRGLKLRGGKLELYEIDQIDPTLLPPTEFRSIVWYYKGLIYLEHGKRYLASREFEKGIDWAGSDDMEWSGILDNGIYFREVKNREEEGEIDLMMTGMLLRAYSEIDIPGKRERALDDLQDYLTYSANKSNFTALNIMAYAAFQFEQGALEKGQDELAKLGNSATLPGLSPMTGMFSKSQSVNDLVRYGVFSYVIFRVLEDWLGRELGVEEDVWQEAYNRLMEFYEGDLKELLPFEEIPSEANPEPVQ